MCAGIVWVRPQLAHWRVFDFHIFLRTSVTDRDAVGYSADWLLQVSTRVTRARFDHIDCDPLHDDHKFPLTYQGQSTCFDLLESSASAPAHADRIASLCAALAARPTVQPDCAVALGMAEVIPPALPAALMQSAEPSIARGSAHYCRPRRRLTAKRQ